MIRYADILTDSIVDGPGIRLVAFLQGCPRVCKGCHNPHLLQEDGGYQLPARDFAKKLLKMLKPSHGGITFSGGDPLLQHTELFNVLSFLKKRKPELNIWVYTGYLYEDVKDLPVLDLIDVLVDGPFIEEEKDIGLFFRGSKNQRIIDVPSSKECNRVINLNLKEKKEYA